MRTRHFNTQDPLGLLIGIKDYNTCEDCAKVIEKGYKKCYECYQESKHEE